MVCVQASRPWQSLRAWYAFAVPLTQIYTSASATAGQVPETLNKVFDNAPVTLRRKKDTTDACKETIEGYFVFST